MTEMISVREAAVRWNITERRVATLCKNGRIAGAKKQGNRWLIPSDTQKPADQRLKTGDFRKTERAPKLPLPIGVSNYCFASSEYYYIDKTMMIKDFIDERPMVTLFTRPRRFGKTLNMDMLRTYFEKSDKDTSVYFRDKKIWACGRKYRDYQGKYPVIFLTFKDVKFDTWEETFAAIRDIFAKETRRHKELLSSDKCDEYSKKACEKLADGKVSEVELASALLDLSAMLHKHYVVAHIIIIDEYDTPIQQDYYDKVIRFMRNLFSGGFKDNQHLSFDFLTGILRVAKESTFSGMNNLSINSVLDNKYGAYFGFTSFIDTGVIYPQIKSNPSTIYSFLLVTGYLKALKTTPSFSGDFMCEVSLPNREISLVYNKEILLRLENLIPPSTAISVQEVIFSGDNARLKAQIQALLSETDLQQINDKKYETELTTAGVKTIYKYVVVFSGKKVEVTVG